MVMAFAVTQAAALESSPAEVIVQIMFQLQNVDALANLIRASPKLLHIFCDDKSNILFHVGKASFHPEAQLDALSIASLCDLPHPLPRMVAENFLNTPIQQRRESLLTTRTLDRAIALCKLYHLIEFFAHDYVVNTLPELCQVLCRFPESTRVEYPSDFLDESVYVLSTDEYARIQRAFCRFELYRHLFSRCCPEADRCLAPDNYSEDKSALRFDGDEQADLFLLRYSAPEIAEIHCVRDFLHRRLRHSLDDAEDLAVANPRPDYYERGCECADGRQCPYIFRYGKRGQEGHIAHITSLGLDYVRQIIRAGDEKVDLLLHGCETVCCWDEIMAPPFLSEGLGLYSETYESHNLIERKSNMEGEWSDPIEGLNNVPLSPGWIWCHNDAQSYTQYRHQGPRSWGYVFWSLDRLEAAGILNQLYMPGHSYNILR